MSLREDLVLRGGVDRVLAARLASPACWPASAELAERARARGIQPPSDRLEPGQAWLVSVRPSNREPSLWRLRPDGAGGAELAEFAGSARDALEAAPRQALRDLPIVVDLPSLRDPAGWRAQPVVGEGVYERVLDGDSFGLAMVLASAALATGSSVPGDLLATAVVRTDGRVDPVDDGLLADKVRLVAEDALGIGRLMVAEAQVDRAGALLARHELHGRVVRVLGPKTVAEALEMAFPDIENVVRRTLAGSSDARSILNLLWRTTLRGATWVLRWGAIAATAEALALRFDGDAVAAHRARVVHRIAKRHEAAPGERLEWPPDEELRALPRPLRLEYLAHVVQSAADSNDDHALEYAVLAGPWTQHFPECHPEDLKVHGAVGRALAAAGRYGEARALLRKVVDAWDALDALSEASFALSELLRVTGLDGRDDELRGLLDAVVPRFEARAGGAPLSRAYVRIAAGRACVTRGWHAEAERLLAERAVDWRQYLPGPWMRWRARSLAARERAEGARTLWRELDRLAAGDPRSRHQRDLARLDEALAAGDAGACEGALHEALTRDGFEHHRVARRYPGPAGDVVGRTRWLADHSRY